MAKREIPKQQLPLPLPLTPEEIERQRAKARKLAEERMERRKRYMRKYG